MPSTTVAIGSLLPVPAGRVPGADRRRAGAGAARFAAALVMLLAGGCGGSLGHRSVAEVSGFLPIGNDIRKVRFEVQNGTIGMVTHAERTIAYAGGVRRAADTAADLAALEHIPTGLTAAVDANDASLLVVRAPALAASDPRAMLGLELGIHLPADLEVEIRIEGSGHVTTIGREGRLEVHTGRGDLRFEGCTKAITARTGRGNVIAFDHRGDIDVRAAVGDMQVFVREPGTRIRLDTGQGTIQCYVPPATGCRVDARAQIGRCNTMFGFPVEVVGSYGAAMVGTQGDGRTEIVLRTGSGHLSLGARAYE